MKGVVYSKAVQFFEAEWALPQSPFPVKHSKANNFSTPSQLSSRMRLESLLLFESMPSFVVPQWQQHDFPGGLADSWSQSGARCLWESMCTGILLPACSSFLQPLPISPTLAFFPSGPQLIGASVHLVQPGCPAQHAVTTFYGERAQGLEPSHVLSRVRWPKKLWPPTPDWACNREEWALGFPVRAPFFKSRPKIPHMPEASRRVFPLCSNILLDWHMHRSSKWESITLIAASLPLLRSPWSRKGGVSSPV